MLIRYKDFVCKFIMIRLAYLTTLCSSSNCLRYFTKKTTATIYGTTSEPQELLQKQLF